MSAQARTAGSTPAPPRRRRGGDSAAERAERLTERELQILHRIARGESSNEIARELGISRHTIRTHVQNILTKLGVHSKLEAITFALRVGKITLDGLPRV